ncbi:MAG: hypothetical protein FWC71_10920 [Defluviitaleaceae bacterium]|nr:hypothetical protein [Defluviitaleaceae bacterium]
MKYKHFTAILLAIPLILLIAGCSTRDGDVHIEDGATAPTLPYTTPLAPLPLETAPPMTPPPETVPPAIEPTAPPPLPQVDTALLASPAFNNRYAHTDTHLFLPRAIGEVIDGDMQWTHVLYRLPLDNIATVEVIPLPGEGSLDIMGLCAQYLYISRRVWQGWPLDVGNWFACTVYKIALDTLEITEVVQYNAFSAPFYHAASHSILAPTFSTYWHVLLESYCLQTGEWSILYNDIPLMFEWGAFAWIQMENGSVVLANPDSTIVLYPFSERRDDRPFIYVSAALDVMSISGMHIAQLWHPPFVPQNAGEAYVMNLPLYYLPAHARSFATVDNWVYFVQLTHPTSLRRCVYRIRTDGTERTLLQAESGITRLFTFHDSLFAVMMGERDELMFGNYLWAVKLSESLEILVHFGSDWLGPDDTFGIQPIPGTTLVAAIGGWHSTLFNSIIGLYCTYTSTVFIP